jgi:pimeloyl-ACP methyl ester carboxylesterase
MATFILVHGTFARRADWSALKEGLIGAANSSNDEARFEQVSWTGSNRARARQIAAEQINSQVDEIRTRSASEKVFLIGHSHGGSAVAYFLKRYPEKALAISGCAFLATPFIAIRPRRDAHEVFTPMSMYLFSVAVAMMPDSEIPFLSLSSGVHWLCTALAFLAWSYVFFFVDRTRAKILVQEAVRDQTADLPVGNYAFVRCSGDEAAAALSRCTVHCLVQCQSLCVVAESAIDGVRRGGTLRGLVYGRNGRCCEAYPAASTLAY